MARVEKIAVLGGGAGSLAAAWYLSTPADWRARYDITVYQQGWRLGGKGASGRNAQLGQRIEEHGLHLWFGFYANAFAIMRQVYAELGRPADAPLAGWDRAFLPQDYLALPEQVGAGWRPWHLVLPRRPGEPGTGGEPVTPWQLALEMLRWLRRWQSDLRPSALLATVAPLEAGLADLLALADSLPADARRHSDADRAALAQALERLARALRAAPQAAAIEDDDTRRTLVALNVGHTILRGMARDEVFVRGFDAIDGIDLRAWLRRHGGDEELCVNSAPIAALYSLMFAFEDGDPARPNVEAGAALRSMLRIAFAYRGSVMYRMAAGMGDAVFAPLYEVLARRGVRFAFFHRVEEILPRGGAVDAVRLSVQAGVPSGAYQPLVTVKGLPSWPNAPDYAQLDARQTALLQEHAIDLESWWSPWPDVYRAAFGSALPQRTLLRGVDFDHVVLGLPVTTLPLVAPAVLEASAPLRASAAALRSVVMQATQVWLDRETHELGWTFVPAGQEPVLTGFSQPFDTWAAMSQVLPAEDWPAGALPRSVQYFCGPLALTEMPPQTDTGFPARAAALARDNAIALLRDRIGALWSAAASGFPWHWLVDPLDGQGPARMDRQ